MVSLATFITCVLMSKVQTLIWTSLLSQRRYIDSLSYDKCSYWKSLWIIASAKYPNAYVNVIHHVAMIPGDCSVEPSDQRPPLSEELSGELQRGVRQAQSTPGKHDPVRGTGTAVIWLDRHEGWRVFCCIPKSEQHLCPVVETLSWSTPKLFDSICGLSWASPFTSHMWPWLKGLKCKCDVYLTHCIGTMHKHIGHD